MTDHQTHLTEEERQTLADGTAPPDRARALAAHLRGCAACAADVAALHRLMTRLSAPSPHDASLDELWPAIRARIDQTKTVSLAPDATGHAVARARRVSAWHVVAATGLVAAAVLVAVLVRPSHRIPVERVAVSPESASAVRAVADSVRSYEEESRILLGRLELQRATMRPEARAALEGDLEVVDRAIDELRAAIARDPGDPALRQLLAASYRQKVDLLKRAGNAS